MNKLQTRKAVERAKGLLIKRFGLDEAEAYERMRRVPGGAASQSGGWS